MKYSFALPLLGGILLGIVTTGAIVLARDDFFWYRNTSMMNSADSTTAIDAVFIKDMIPHHQGAIEMANLALEKAKTDEVKNLSKNIITAQQEEIDQMTAWYKEWFGEEVPLTASSNIEINTNSKEHGMMHMDSMSGNMSSLESASNFDEEFVKQMIPHHEMAIMMAQMLLKTTSRNEMKTLAQNIIDTQTMEIEEMRSWLESWK